MQKLILAALATVAVFCGTVMEEKSVANELATWTWVRTTSTQTFDVADKARWEKLRYSTWLDLCLDYRGDADCRGFEVPKIRTFKPNPFRPGLAGYYDGGDTVFIRRGLKPNERREVLAHEMSHYLDQKLNLLPPMPVLAGDAENIFLLCMSEKRAWRVSDLYWQRQGYGDNSSKMIKHRWVQWYKHCTPFKARLYPDVYGS